jgi:hypothetical protein
MMNNTDKDIFIRRFPLLQFTKHQLVAIKIVEVDGIKDTLSARSSHTSPLRKDSHLFSDEKHNLSTLIDSCYSLTLVDIPIITMKVDDVIDDKLLFCGLIQDTTDALKLIIYAEISMSRLSPSARYLTSSNDIEVFVSLKSIKRPFINESLFCFLSHTPDKRMVKMSKYMKIQSWTQIYRNSLKRKKIEELSPGAFTNKDELYDKLVLTLTQMKDDVDFMRRVDEFMQNDKAKNKKITNDEYLRLINTGDDDDD